LFPLAIPRCVSARRADRVLDCPSEYGLMKIVYVSEIIRPSAKKSQPRHPISSSTSSHLLPRTFRETSRLLMSLHWPWLWAQPGVRLRHPEHQRGSSDSLARSDTTEYRNHGLVAGRACRLPQQPDRICDRLAGVSASHAQLDLTVAGRWSCKFCF